MTTTLRTDVVTRMTLTPAELLFYKEQGYLPLPGMVQASALEGLREEVLEVLASRGLTWERLCKASETADKLRQCNVYKRGSRLDALINSEATLSLASQLAGGPAIRYLPFTAVKAGGGGGQFHCHQDNNYTRHEPALGSLNIWVALVDMTPDNGCLVMVPRSHHAQAESRNSDDGDGHQQVDVPPEQCFPIRMRAGDAVAFTRWTIHGSGPNNTNQPRLAYALQYHRNDVRWLDRTTDEWKLLVDHARFSTEPVEQIEPVTVG